MHRRHILNILLALSALKVLPFTPEQALANNAAEVDALLRAAYQHSDGKYVRHVLQNPKQVADQLGIPCSPDTIDVITTINQGIQPTLSAFEPSSPKAEHEPYGPDAVQFFEALLKNDQLDTDWYKDPAQQARAFEIHLSPKSAKAITELGKKFFDPDSSTFALSGQEAISPVIATVIVVVIVFGPRGASTTDGITHTPQTQTSYQPIIDPNLFSKY